MGSSGTRWIYTSWERNTDYYFRFPIILFTKMAFTPSNFTASGMALDAIRSGPGRQAVRGNMSALPADKAAFDRLMVEHLPAALALAIKLTGSVQQAEDLVQNALLKAAKA